MIKCALLISTYNWPEALSLCLESVRRQSHLPEEIIIADDGSTGDTADLIKDFEKRLNMPILHIWQEDKGFRKCEILNKAIAKVSQDYIIQIDGDVILEEHFIADHLKLSRPNSFVVGSRAMLSAKFSAHILQFKKLPSLFLLRKRSIGQLNSMRNSFLSRFLSTSYKVRGKNKYYAKGCNMAFWKKDIIEINGYNENITGWGCEDEELVVRLFKAGKKKLFLKMSGVLFHIWHKRVSRQNEDRNKQILKEALLQSNFKCDLGINQYL
ncbi:glycosyltransferase family 2 protein [Arachidicoccus soli]|uniref:glycosyltransferase family 2 protein n=1 Tax=Arachidicoccus soli TaxID=2341117 RepID=UPI00196973D3|nr:glycosyltransferase family 2 protein [Arachidicoccus soli]